MNESEITFNNDDKDRKEKDSDISDRDFDPYLDDELLESNDGEE